MRSVIPARTRRSSGRHAGGFTLIEIMIALLIVGILASIGVLTYQWMLGKARMTQAKTTLAHLAKMQAIYYGSHDVYTDNVILLDYDPVKYDFYTVSVLLDNGAQGFTGIATGTGPMTGDYWTITQEGIPVQADNSAFK